MGVGQQQGFQGFAIGDVGHDGFVQHVFHFLDSILVRIDPGDPAAVLGQSRCQRRAERS
jgi:hypothetical protein